MTLPYIDIPSVSPVSGTVSVPGSKSITNRALILSALANGKSVLKNALRSIDTDVACDCLKKLGVSVTRCKTTFSVDGNPSITASPDPLYVENAGTMARFLIPILLAGKGKYILDGNERMRQRPVNDLIECLRSVGSTILETRRAGCLPLEILSNGYLGGTMAISGKNSSQYISALMLAAPLAKKNISIRIQDTLVSHTYVNMTKKVMGDFGMTVASSANAIQIAAGQAVTPREYVIEADASSASYFFSAAAITSGTVTVKNINRQSLQGDLGILDILEKMGCTVRYGTRDITLTGAPLRGVDVNMNTMSDAAPTLAVVALFAKGTTRIYDVENMRIKECNRISALHAEISKTGARITEQKDGLTIEGGTIKTGATFETYDDHRMAMALSLIGLNIPSVRIMRPECVSKTFPGYFDALFALIGVRSASVMP